MKRIAIAVVVAAQLAATGAAQVIAASEHQMLPVNFPLQAPISFIALPATQSPQDPQEFESQFRSRLYQIVVVKASTLMPPPLRRQILRHRREILRGCLEPLRIPPDHGTGAADVLEAFETALEDLRGKVPFSRVCYSLGRLSALLNEYASPLRYSGQPDELSAFRELFSEVLYTFPLVITHEGEAYLLQNSLSGYLQYISQRRGARIELLSREIKDSDPQGWRDQRSLPYGLAALIYNDMVMDSARLWLYLWQEAGGDISDAPYFRLPGNRDEQ